MVALLLSGCVSASVPSVSSPVHYVRIERTVTPWDLSVGVGDEIRWVNLTGSTITVFFDAGRSAVSCRNGFRQAPVAASIPPDDYLSLCAKQPGLLSYAVKLKTSGPGMVHTALIRVNGRSVQEL